MKKGLTLLLALVLCMSMCVVSFAQEPAATPQEPADAPQELADAPAQPAGEDFLPQVFEALEDPVYQDILEALKTSGPITKGTVSELAKGLQKTLVDFGCNIAIDGSAGPGTFAALNQVLTAFGKENTESVDAALYEELLPLLLLSRDTEEEYAPLLMQIYPEGENSSAYRYLKGCAHYAAGEYYKALEAFEESGYEDYEERVAACMQDWPQYGELFHNDSYYSNAMKLTFQVNSHSETEGMCFQIYAEDRTLASVLFLTGNGSVSTWLPGGNYRIKDATGTEWYGLKDTFGRHGNYEYMTFDEFQDPYLTQLNAGYEWLITVNVIEGSPEATGVGSYDTDWENW